MNNVIVLYSFIEKLFSFLTLFCHKYCLVRYNVNYLSGGTADLSVHEILADRNLREIYRADGDALGGIMVDLEFFKFMEGIFGSNVMRLFSERYNNLLMEIQLHFETKKRKFDFEDKSSFEQRIELPMVELNTVLKELQEGNVKEKIKTAAEKKGFESLNLKARKLCFGKEIMKSFFANVIEGIIKFINAMRTNDTVGEINQLLMVGGLSESTYVQDIIKQKVHGVIIIVPSEPSLAVLRGAVIAGHNPMAITERIARYTYGFSFARPFKHGEDPDVLKVVKEGMEFCNNVFKKLITKGDALKVGDHYDTPCLLTVDYNSLLEILMSVLPVFADVYRSEDKDPKYTDENHGCELVGQIMIPPPPSGWPRFSLLVQQLVVGEAEFTVRAIDKNTGRSYEGQLDFLGSIDEH